MTAMETSIIGLEDQAGASRFLRLSTRKLQAMRADGTGPAWFRVDGKMIRYPIDGLHRWVAEQIEKQRDLDGTAA